MNLSQLDWKIGILGVLAIAGGGLAIKELLRHKRSQKNHLVLLGDVGGTNIRLQLVTMNEEQEQPEQVIKWETFLVERYASLRAAIKDFLVVDGKTITPCVAVVAVAGPVADNKVIVMANVMKWGTLSGEELGRELRIEHFKLINDFQAVSYGIPLLRDEQFQSLNGLPPIKEKIRGVMGPGTGLGTSVLYTEIVHGRPKITVLAAEGGHIDPPVLDQETLDYLQFLKKEGGFKAISLERAFCGPAIPMMLKFFHQRYPAQGEGIPTDQTSEAIMRNCLQQSSPQIYARTFDLFMRIYSAAIGNFIAQHMCTGGIYLCGGLTKSILPKISGVDILHEWKQRQIELAGTLQRVPILVCLEVQLGLKGAFYVARRILIDRAGR